ncbi:S-adenosyl-L-methionine-dependent methyltransferase [Setomelanomma holmii]|uniref:S-adenosyl-L-methionine-dependent methyltransferase n=1 Tax=Setomelanomma holmii TaxID=210430 RepID=A0A9P4LIP1_9PLEO|nr:S-adenosyl-L-methionine-dependent methyltransferase [Setomelanomma holmii]
MMSTPITVQSHFNDGAAKYEASTGGCTRELAQYIVDISPPFDESSHVLDNACGLGIVAQEILFNHAAARKFPATITCVDFAPAMIELGRNFFQTNAAVAEHQDRVSFDVMSGEDLRLPDNHFTHSFTNVGILFFKDGPRGASEIYRTLKPEGTATVTSWAKLGYIDLIHQAQRVVKPDAPLFRIPIAEDWYQGAHLEKVMRDAGFENVQVHEKEGIHYTAKSVGELCDRLVMLFGAALGLTESELAHFRKELELTADKVVVKVERSGQAEALVGVPMIALVAVAKK